MILRLFIIIFLLCANQSSGQKLHFSEISLSTALAIAKEKNKNIFIDTYASYCKPCKIMEREFQNPDVARFYNKNFVNVRVNMEREKAKEYEIEYQVVFLPTMLYLTPEGRVLTKLDRIVPANELLSIGKLFSNEPQPRTSKPTASVTTRPSRTSESKTKPRTTTVTSRPKVNPPITRSAPVSKAKVLEKKTEVIESAPADGSKILYVMGQDTDNLPPEILKEEAYFRMQLMDGSHKSAARNYLDSQEEWTTEENVKFIHDFMDDARSEEFDFLIANRDRFHEVIGEELVSQTINILVNKELERGYPRPKLERAIQLYSYAERENPQTAAQVYHLNNLFESGDKKAFIAFSETIDIKKINDAKVLTRVASEKAATSGSRKNLKNCLNLAERAIALNPKVATYHYNKAQIAFLLKNRKLAYASAKEALSLIKDDAAAKKRTNMLLDQIELL